MENYVLSLKLFDRHQFTAKLSSSHNRDWLIYPAYYPRNERWCKDCNNHIIGDEKHLLLSCKSYSSQRNQLFQELAECSDIMHDFGTFFTFMNYNQGDVEIASTLYRYVESCF